LRTITALDAHDGQRIQLCRQATELTLLNNIQHTSYSVMGECGTRTV